MTETVPEKLMQMLLLQIPAGRMGKPEGLQSFLLIRIFNSGALFALNSCTSHVAKLGIIDFILSTAESILLCSSSKVL